MKQKSKIIISAAMLGLTLTSCTSLESLRKISPQGTPFQQALTRLYTQFAESEAEQYDWIDSQYFIEKAMRSAYGNTVAPELPKNWKIPASSLKEITQAHQSLTTALKNDYALVKLPEVAAKAQFSFDCWLEQLEENWQIKDIEQCRTNFYRSLNDLNKAVPEKPAAKEVIKSEITKPIFLDEKSKDKKESKKKLKGKKEKAIKNPARVEESDNVYSYHVAFENKTNHLTPKAEKAIKTIISKAKRLNNFEIVINGYTENIGSEEKSLSLSKQRAELIKKHFTQAGIKEKNISIFAFGDANPRALLTENLKEPGKKKIDILAGE